MPAAKIFALLLPIILWSSAQASYRPVPSAVFVNNDMNPLTMNFGTPPVALGAELGAGVLKFDIALNYANSLHAQEKGIGKDYELIFLDYEASRSALGISYGLSDDWNLRFELPVFAYSAGMLDSAIDDYHQRFGFDEGPRPHIKQNKFRLFYQRAQQRLIDINQGASGVGDARLMLVRSLETAYEDSLSYGLLLKAPTGKVENLTGSGSFDAALWLSSTNYLLPNLSHYAGIGGVYIEKNAGLLADIRRDGYGIFSYGINFNATRQVDLRAQFEYRSSIYKSATKILGDSITATLGGSIAFAHGYKFELSITEDIDVGSAPDVNFLFQLSKSFAN